MPGVGDMQVPQLVVDPYDTTTEATLLVEAPDGTTSTPPVSTADGGHTWLTGDPISYDLPGWWVLLWTVTGTGGGAEPQPVYVTGLPEAGGPLWAPDRVQVANYIPGRTVVVNGAGLATRYTFDATTRPSGGQVDGLIRDATAWVEAATGAVNETLWPMATAATGMRAAGLVELGWPDRESGLPIDGMITVARELLDRAEQMRTDLARANAAITGDDPTNPGSNLLPQWAFPPPVPWGDELL